MRTLILALISGLFSVPPIWAEQPAPTAAVTETFQKGEESARFCRHCHGKNGISVHPDIPNLAGQNAAYLLDQMNKFAAAKRKNEFMEGLIKALKPEERASIALYFSRQVVMPQPARHSTQVELGKNLYSRLCMHCHGANAYGSDSIPRLAGQQTVYLQLSLKRYRSGSGERIDPRMQAYTRNLKDQDIDNLAVYLAGLR